MTLNLTSYTFMYFFLRDCQVLIQCKTRVNCKYMCILQLKLLLRQWSSGNRTIHSSHYSNLNYFCKSHIKYQTYQKCNNKWDKFNKAWNKLSVELNLNVRWMKYVSSAEGLFCVCKHGLSIYWLNRQQFTMVGHGLKRCLSWMRL